MNVKTPVPADGLPAKAGTGATVITTSEEDAMNPHVQHTTTDALQLANDLHDFGELLADLAGVEP